MTALVYRAQFSRSRGAQPGNDNALKHGFYARQFTRSDLPGLENLDPGGMRDEVILLRVILRRVLAYAKEVKDLPSALSLLRGISVATHSIACIMRAQYYVNNNNPESNLDIALAIQRAAARVIEEKGYYVPGSPESVQPEVDFSAFSEPDEALKSQSAAYDLEPLPEDEFNPQGYSIAERYQDGDPDASSIPGEDALP